MAIMCVAVVLYVVYREDESTGARVAKQRRQTRAAGQLYPRAVRDHAHVLEQDA